jgi:hypothetical protein
VGSTTLNLLLTINETRTLEAMQIRAASGETSTFRVGSRYPILTAVSTASTSNSTLISELEADKLVRQLERNEERPHA